MLHFNSIMNSSCDTPVIKPLSALSEAGIMEIENLLKCPRCKDFFKVPVLLPSCSHNFCYGCVPGNVGVEECPTCGQRVHDEDTPVRNEILDDLVRIFRESIQVAAQSGDESTCSRRRHRSKFWTYEPVLNDVEKVANDVAANLKPVSKTRVILDKDIVKGETSRRTRGRSLRTVLSISDIELEDVSNIDREANAQPLEFTSVRTLMKEQTLDKMTRSWSNMPKEHVDIANKKGHVAKEKVVMKKDISYNCSPLTTGEQARGRSLKRHFGTSNVESPRRRSLRASPLVCRGADGDASTSSSNMTKRRSSRAMSLEASSATAKRKVKDLKLASPHSGSEGRLNNAGNDGGNLKNKKRSSKFWTYEVVVPNDMNEVQDSPSSADIEGDKRSTLRSSSFVSDTTDSDAKPSPRSNSEGRMKGFGLNGKSESVANKKTNSAKKKGSSKFWTYVPVGQDIESPVTEVTGMSTDDSDQGVARSTRRSRNPTCNNMTGTGSDLMLPQSSHNEGRLRDHQRQSDWVEKVRDTPNRTREKRPRSCTPGSPEKSASQSTKMPDGYRDNTCRLGLDKRRKSKFWEYVPVPVVQEAEISAGSDVEGKKRPTRRSCSAASFKDSHGSDSQEVRCDFDSKSPRLHSRKRSKVLVRKRGGSTFWTYLPVVDQEVQLGEVAVSGAERETRASRRSCSVGNSDALVSKSTVASLFSNSNVVLELEGKPLDKSTVNTDNGAAGLVSTSVELQNTQLGNAQNILAGSSSEVLSTAVLPSRKRKRSPASRSPAAVRTLLARQKRRRTDPTGFRKRLNTSVGWQSSVSEQASSSEDVYDFDSLEENIPDSLGGSQERIKQLSPKIGQPKQKKDKTSFVTPKQKKKKTHSETFEQDSAGFLSPFTSPTVSSLAAPKPITPLVAGIFCNSPAFGAVKFAEDEDHVDGFGYVDDSSSEADSDDDLLGSISQRIDNFDEEEGDHPDINHNIPNMEVEKLWPALSKRPADEPQPSTSNSQRLARKSPKKTQVENLHLVPESPIIDRLGGRVFRKRTLGEQQLKPRRIEKAKKRL